MCGEGGDLLAGSGASLPVYDVGRVLDDLLGEAKPQTTQTDSARRHEEHLPPLVDKVLDLRRSTREGEGSRCRWRSCLSMWDRFVSSHHSLRRGGLRNIRESCQTIAHHVKHSRRHWEGLLEGKDGIG